MGGEVVEGLLCWMNLLFRCINGEQINRNARKASDQDDGGGADICRFLFSGTGRLWVGRGKEKRMALRGSSLSQVLERSFHPTIVEADAEWLCSVERIQLLPE